MNPWDSDPVVQPAQAQPVAQPTQGNPWDKDPVIAQQPAFDEAGRPARKLSPQEAHEWGIRQGLSEDQIKNNTAIRLSQEMTPNPHDPAVQFATGTAKGAMGLAGLPGDIEDLSRRVGAWAKNKVTPQTLSGLITGPQDPGHGYLPTSRDVTESFNQSVGPLRDPTTTTDRYLQAFGEFTPAGLGSGAGNIARKALTNVAAPAAVSEYAGESFKGSEMEPWARALGAGVGGAAANRAINPVRTPAWRQPFIDTANQEGFGQALTAGQLTGSTPLRKLEQTASEIPGVGSTAEEAFRQGKEGFTRASLRRAGMDAPLATPEVMEQGLGRIQDGFNRLTASHNMHLDQQSQNELLNTVTEYHNRVNPPNPFVENTMNNIAQKAGQQGGSLTGVQYQQLRSELAAHARQASIPGEQHAVNDLTHILDNAMERSIGASGNPADLGAFQNARQQYRNFLVLENAALRGGAENAAQGIITPAALKTAEQSIFGRRSSALGRTPFNELQRSGSVLLKEPPNSGTPSGQAARGFFQSIGGLGGAALGYGMGGTESSVLGTLVGEQIPHLIEPFTAGPVGKALMSRPIQNYLKGQTGVQQALGPNTPNRLLQMYRLHLLDQPPSQQQ
jgi:hypothetical protein